MKLDNYELVISFAMPCYLYIEGESKEKALRNDDSNIKYWPLYSEDIY